MRRFVLNDFPPRKLWYDIAMERSLEPFIHRKIVILSETDSGYAAAQAMCENHVGSVVVTNRGGELVGVLTDRDLVCQMLALNLSPDTEIKDLIHSDLIVADEKSTLREVIALMEQHGVRRIPIVRSERCVGIVTLDDLIAAQTIEYPQASRIVRSQIRSLHLSASPGGDSSGSMVRSFAEKAGLKLDHARAVAKFIMSALVRRFHYTAAVQFISQVPSEFHLDLLDLPAGPDRSIDEAYFMMGVAAHLHASAFEVQECLGDFWSTLLEFGDAYKLNHALLQLPKAIRGLFKTTELPAKNSHPHWPAPPT